MALRLTIATLLSDIETEWTWYRMPRLRPSRQIRADRTSSTKPTNSSRKARMLACGGSPIVVGGFQFFIVIQWTCLSQMLICTRPGLESRSFVNSRFSDQDRIFADSSYDIFPGSLASIQWPSVQK